MKQKQIITWLLLAAMMLSAASCGSGEDASVSDTPTEDTTAETTAGYPYPTKDFGGYTFKILNLDEQYGCYIRVDFDEQTGETLDDAVYNRNRRVEERLNFQLDEVILTGGSAWSTGQISVCDALIQSVMADDDIYDAAYSPIYFKPSLVTDGYVLNLLDIPELHLYDEYWDAVVNEEMTAGDTLYTASGPLNFMSLDLSWALLFNQDMMDDRKMEYPYQLVRDGKWTLDKMNEYVEAGANLNGDESFAIKADGSCIYGIAAHLTSPTAFLNAADVDIYERDSSGDLKMTFGGERIYDALEKIAKMCTKSDGKAYYNNANLTDPTGYMSLFASNRALFITCELKSAMEERAMEATFGLVPMPKLDETQKSYRSYVTYSTAFLTIPKTQDDPSRTGMILDALTYESWKDVLPIYYDITVSQKGLRNEESIEMMKIVRDCRSIDFTRVYTITEQTGDNIARLVSGGTGDTGNAASIIAKGIPAAQTKLDEIVGLLAENK
ncbi:MAG: hypothetical protein E7632_09975 [Ruminococcaceae bacterium]|nr:hypothetical protein [Oscillospiraceae bacterium]